MGQILFERPREKIQNYGARHLTTTELLQVIIGTGTAKVPGGRLAKRVGRLVMGGQASYENLMSLHGLGVAKACQILAAIEIGRRFQQQPPKSTSHTANALFIERARTHKHGTLLCCWMDGANNEIDSKAYLIRGDHHAGVIIKQVMADALAVSARSLHVFIVVQQHTRTPTTKELALLANLKEAALLLRITVAGVWAVSKAGHASWSAEL